MVGYSKTQLLYRSKVEYADFCINHVKGCSHGCKFPCYAMIMSKRFGQIKSYEEWCKPVLVDNALELLDAEIPKYKDQIKFVHLCFMTDPFMYKHDEVKKLSLEIIRKLNDNGIKCTVLTKGILPKELGDRRYYNADNSYGITLVSLDPQFKSEFEPFSAPYPRRIRSLKYLHDAGFETWVSMEPYPTPNLVEQELEDILESISFVNKIIFGKLNYNVKSSLYQDNEGFYKECADHVAHFCKSKGINYHIKYGTPNSIGVNNPGMIPVKSTSVRNHGNTHSCRAI